MKIVEQIFQSPDGKLYAFDKAKDENYKLIAQSARYSTNNTAGPRNTLILNGWKILTSVDDNPGYEVELYAASYEDDQLKYAIESMVKRIHSEKGYVLRGNVFSHIVLRGGGDID